MRTDSLPGIGVLYESDEWSDHELAAELCTALDETFGEDPYLIGEMASAIVKGYQGGAKAGEPLAKDAILACAKHFAGYSETQGGRDAFPVGACGAAPPPGGGIPQGACVSAAAARAARNGCRARV